MSGFVRHHSDFSSGIWWRESRRYPTVCGATTDHAESVYCIPTGDSAESAQSPWQSVVKPADLPYNPRRTERCESGRFGTIGNRVRSNPPWVRIPPSPPFYLTFRCSSYNIRSGRAKWGASGALYPQSAIAGLNALLRPVIPWDWSGQAALKAGSCAAETFEPRQIRKEATVRSAFWVTQGRLAGAGCPGKPGDAGQDRVHDPSLFRTGPDWGTQRSRILPRQAQ